MEECCTVRVKGDCSDGEVEKAFTRWGFDGARRDTHGRRNKKDGRILLLRLRCVPVGSILTVENLYVKRSKLGTNINREQYAFFCV